VGVELEVFCPAGSAESMMDPDRVEGSAKKMKGNVKDAAGKALGDKKMQREGKADKAEGEFQNAVGSTEDNVKEKLG
jgi:uncharacterized protein YjbJ (UPF0337 family)